MKPRMLQRACAWVLTVFVVLLWQGTTGAEIRVENATDRALRVFLKGLTDKEFRGPYEVPGRTEMGLPVPPGKYLVATQHPNKRVDYLGWQDYSRHKITYSISMCMSCAPAPLPGTAPTPVEILSVGISHADGSYRCRQCGQVHTRWSPGWGNDDEHDRPGTTDDHGVFRPDYDSFGSFRLGVSVIDDPDGVMIVTAEDESPALQMRRMGEADRQTYRLTPSVNVITHVNGRTVRNSSEFSHRVAESDRYVEVTVINRNRGSVRDYWTYLRK